MISNKHNIQKASNNAPPRTIGRLIFYILRETLRQKKWILLPLWILLICIGIILVLTGNSFILPAIYIVGF